MKLCYVLNGELKIVHLAPKEDIEKTLGMAMSDDEYLAHCKDRSRPMVDGERIDVDFVDIADDFIPSDRYFRNAWELVNGKIEINIEKARAIHTEKVSEQLLENQRKDEIKAKLETNKSDPMISNIGNINDLNELKNTLPESLKQK